jgi:hypothetical protein
MRIFQVHLNQQWAGSSGVKVTLHQLNTYHSLRIYIVFECSMLSN